MVPGSLRFAGRRNLLRSGNNTWLGGLDPYRRKDFLPGDCKHRWDISAAINPRNGNQSFLQADR